MRMPSSRTRGARSATRLCTPRSRIRAPMPFTPDAGTMRRPGKRLLRTSVRLRAPGSGTTVAASLASRAALLSCAAWPRSDWHRRGMTSATAARREEALMAARECRKVHAAPVPRWDWTRALRQCNTEICLEGVVRRFPRDHDVVRVRLAQPRRGHLDEFGLGAERLDVAHAAVPHAAAQPAGHLEDHVGHGVLRRVRH